MPNNTTLRRLIESSESVTHTVEESTQQEYIRIGRIEYADNVGLLGETGSEASERQTHLSAYAKNEGNTK